MATLALGALGTLIGGPIGGAIGALAGRQIDSTLIGSGAREGPRLDDLTISTSSYGTPLARHFGRVRAAGTIIWATDLQENRETSGGGKGKPKTTSFSYLSSFAVALSSRPIIRVGRIWADGNLLRGTAGDLKVGGTLRVYDGRGDQLVDPIISSAQGASCPAFRGCAYAVFEDLQLEDFGNRIPALSFEVFADEGQLTLSSIIEPLTDNTSAAAALSELAGFSYKGGPLVRAIETINTLFPTIAGSDATGSTVIAAVPQDAETRELPQPIPALESDDFGSDLGTSLRRDASQDTPPSAIRYYDTSRDYQAGVQRPEGRANWSGNQIVEFPAAIAPDDARFLINRAARHAQRQSETLSWRVAELDPDLSLGSLVTVPDQSGTWIITAWEWHERGIELGLERTPIKSGSSSGGDHGTPALPIDSLTPPTWLRAFELPWNGAGSGDDLQIYAALAAENSDWAGAALYSKTSGPLTPIGQSGRSQATMGKLTSALAPSSSLLFEQDSTIDVQAISPTMVFQTAGLTELANGQNRALVGDEIIQFASAEPVAPNLWRLKGILRGRGGSEAAAALGHTAETHFTLLDEGLVEIDIALIPVDPASAIAAIGRGDDEAVIAPISSRGAGLRPLSPVHPKFEHLPDGSVKLCWTRRARGAWRWLDGVQTPLVEATESYRIGIGNVGAPEMMWEVREPAATLTAAHIAEHSGESVWVRQIGQASLSWPLLLAILP